MAASGSPKCWCLIQVLTKFKFMRVPPVYACLVFLLASCGQATHERQVKLLDSLKTQVQTAGKTFEASVKDSAHMAEISTQARNRLIVFPKVYQPDTVDVDVMLMIEQYKQYTLVADRYNIQRQRIKLEIPYTLKQIESLLTDLNNKALKRKDAEKYVQAEKHAAVSLVHAVNFLQQEADITFKKFDSLGLHVHTLIDSLQSDSANIAAIRLKMLKAKTKRRK